MTNSRILFDDNKKVVVITNNKCGYGSANLTFPKWRKDIRSENQLNSFCQKKTLTKYTKILVCRNPYARFVSFLKWGCIHGLYSTGLNKFAIHMDKNDLKEFNRCVRYAIKGSSAWLNLPGVDSRASIVGKDEHKIFEMLIKYLHKCYTADEHWRPQCLIYHYNNRRLVNFDYIFDLDKFDNKLFEELTGKSLCHRNSSVNTADLYKEFFTTSDYAKFNRLYKKDFEDLPFSEET